MYHEDLDELEIYIRYVKYIDEQFKYIIETQKIEKDIRLVDKIKNQKINIRIITGKITGLANKLENNRITKEQEVKMHQELSRELIPKITKLIELQQEMDKIYYDKLKLRKQQLFLYENIKPHYHRLTNQSSYYWNKCGDKILGQSDIDHQIFGRIQ